MKDEDIEQVELDEPDADEEADGEFDSEIESPLDDDVIGDDDADNDDNETDDVPTRTRKKGRDDDDDDDEMLSPDDVEADLDTILKDRLVTADDDDDDDDDEQAPRTKRSNQETDAIQPRRKGEVQCPVCFLLVRADVPCCLDDEDHFALSK